MNSQLFIFSVTVLKMINDRIQCVWPPNKIMACSSKFEGASVQLKKRVFKGPDRNGVFEAPGDTGNFDISPFYSSSSYNYSCLSLLVSFQNVPLSSLLPYLGHVKSMHLCFSHGWQMCRTLRLSAFQFPRLYKQFTYHTAQWRLTSSRSNYVNY